MSTLKVNAIRQTGASSDAITLASNGTCTANITSNLSNRNLILNGAMEVSQRGTSKAGTGYIIDRYKVGGASSVIAYTQSQSTHAPTGFDKSLRVEITSAGSPANSDYTSITYKIEDRDMQHLLNGTSGAKKVTISFWVSSPKTGNHVVNIYKAQNTTRQIAKTYSVSAANTWEKKTITFDGDTSGGGITNNGSFGYEINWVLFVGSNFNTSSANDTWANYADGGFGYGHAVNVGDSTSNNFYITGIQCEVGEYASEFEYMSYNDTLRKCQRYYEKTYGQTAAPGTATWSGSVYSRDGTASAVNRYIPYSFKVTKRATPNITVYAPGTGASGKLNLGSSVYNASLSSYNDNSTMVYATGTGQTIPSHYDTSFHLVIDAEYS